MSLPRPFITLALLLLLSVLTGLGAEPARKPNFIFILADDLGWGDLGSYGQEKIHTPNLDRLARDGMRFTDFYAGCAVCAPSRCSLLTGFHQGHAAIRDNQEKGRTVEGQAPMPRETQTIAQWLKAGGYSTGLIGKWGLGMPEDQSGPADFGFTDHYGYLCQRMAHTYYPPYLWRNGVKEMLEGNPPVSPIDLHGPISPDGKTWAHAKLADESLRWVRAHQSGPFYLQLSYTIPHLSLQVPEEDLAEYRGRWPETPYDGNAHYAAQPTPHAAYAAMVSRMDRDIGRLLALLAELKLEQDTVVLFASDNGAMNGISGLDVPFFKSNGPFRGGKQELWEGGIRSPLIVRWPGRVAAGTTSDRAAAFWDVPATFCELAGITAPVKTDGVSFAPTLLGQAQPPAPFLYWEYQSAGGAQAVRLTGPEAWKGVRWKVKKDAAAPIELYQLSNDPGETHNVAAEHPDVVAKIRAILIAEHGESPVKAWNFPAPGGAVTESEPLGNETGIRFALALDQRRPPNARRSMSSLRRLIILAGFLALGLARGGEIHDAAMRGDVAKLTTLAAAGPAARASTDAEGLTALHLAVIHRHPEAVAVLLKLGAPIEARDKDGQTPLHHLAHSVEESVLENFRRSGGGKFGEALADLTKSGQSVTPGALLTLLRADIAGEEDPLRLLRNFAAASTAEQMDAEVRCARALLAANANVHALDRERSTPLHHAAMSPRPDLARLLIEAGAKPNAQNSTGLTPLHNAALFASPETVEYLLQQGAEPEGRSVLIGVPPLLMAVTRGDARVVTKLLEHKADVNALGPDGETALARASVLGAADVVQVLLDRGARVKVRFARVNHTPLHVAAAHGFLPIVQLLLDAGAEPDARDSNGFTPLLDAAEQGRTMAVRALLNAGAKVNNTNTSGRTALWLAAARGQEETVTFLLKHDADPALAGSDGQAPLHIAAYDARPASLRALLAAKPPLNNLSRIGTALHAAAAGPMLRAIANTQLRSGSSAARAGTLEDSAACAKMLLDAGAPVDALDSNGLSPVQTAAAFGNKDVLKIFASNGTGILTARDGQGLTPLHHAARGPLVPGYTPEAQPTLPAEILAGCGEAVTYLLAHGAKLNAKDLTGLTPLHHAASAGNAPALKALLAAGADVKAVDNAGSTPLHWAAARGRVDVATQLLAAHAGRDTTDGEGQTPLHMAVAAGHPEVVRLLLDAGSEPNLVNRRGQNALAYADAYNRPDIGRLLRQYGAKSLLVPRSADQF